MLHSAASFVVNMSLLKALYTIQISYKYILRCRGVVGMGNGYWVLYTI